jgi:hypothetical protein
VLSLSHPDVVVAKARFEANRRKFNYATKADLEFDYLFEKFQEKTISRVSFETGLSKQAIYQIYKKYFRDLFGVSGWTNFRIVRRKERATRVAYRKGEQLERENIKEIVKSAQEAGLFISAVVLENQTGARVSTKLLLINNMVCYIHTMSACWKIFPEAKKVYARAGISCRTLRSASFQVYLVNARGFPQRIFVVPSDLLLKEYASTLKGKYPTVYLPVYNEQAYHGQQPRIDWWQYENAWHLLKEVYNGSHQKV